MVLVSQGGFIKELRTFTDEVNGIPQAEGDDDSGVEMGGYYVPGYMGNDSPEIVKFWRHATVESTRPVTIEVRLVDEDFTSPTIVSVPPEQQIKGKAGINRKSRRLSPAIIFDEIDVDCSVFTYRVGMIPLSDR